MDAYFEAVDGDIVIKFKKLLVEEGVNHIIVDGPQNVIYTFSGTFGKGHGSNRVKSVINLSLGGTSKFIDPNQCKWLARGILAGLAWEFLALLAVGATLLQDFLPPGPTWFKIYELCNSLNCLFTIAAFSLSANAIEKYGRKNFYFKHASMGLAIIVVFQILVEFNRPKPPPPP